MQAREKDEEEEEDERLLTRGPVCATITGKEGGRVEVLSAGPTYMCAMCTAGKVR